MFQILVPALLGPKQRCRGTLNSVNTFWDISDELTVLIPSLKNPDISRNSIHCVGWIQMGRAGLQSAGGFGNVFLFPCPSVSPANLQLANTPVGSWLGE